MKDLKLRLTEEEFEPFADTAYKRGRMKHQAALKEALDLWLQPNLVRIPQDLMERLLKEQAKEHLEGTPQRDLGEILTEAWQAYKDKVLAKMGDQAIPVNNHQIPGNTPLPVEQTGPNIDAPEVTRASDSSIASMLAVLQTEVHAVLTEVRALRGLDGDAPGKRDKTTEQKARTAIAKADRLLKKGSGRTARDSDSGRTGTGST